MNLQHRLKQVVSEPVVALLRRVVKRSGARNYRLPSELRSNHRMADAAGLAALKKSIADNYHVGWRARESYSADGYEQDVKAHLADRIEHDRHVIVPWLNSLQPLRHLKILEVGCGTGSSTVALAEQGASVVSIDVDEGALQVARDRCRIYGCAADIRLMNASQLETEFGQGEFQLVLFFACLEHMTVGERLQALSQAWKILPPGGMLGVIETPNRLWFHDGHTAFLPFFHWLPDELAFQYARFSPRENFREVYQGPRAESAMHFLRRGRGVSFHEFDVAIQPVGSLAVAESLSSFQQKHHMSRPSAAHATFAEFLQQQAPTVPAPFFEEDLNLVLRKN